ncbi:MAG: hypothetical protein ACTHNZ_02510 [Trinickia sp.]|uniref:hypothetical protein n=1 Tax=Trinickia sp. TaxID=2571163 RepID=UPI003F7E2C6E
MIARTLAALAVAGLAVTSTVTAQAQERQLGHESAVGPHSAEHGPGGMGEGRMGEGRQAAPGPMRQGGPAPGVPAAPSVRPGPSVAPGRAPQGQALGQRPIEQAPMRQTQPAPQRPMQQAPRVPMRPNNEATGVPNHGPRHAPDMSRRAPVAPIEHAPRAFGAVPAPYRGNIHRFVDQDARVWRGGRWHHDHHRGRFGWWWVVGGLWYFYPQPVYPYPDPFSPGDVEYGPSEPGQYWYYCESAGQYYPYVTDCPEGWQAVIPDDR